MVLIGGSAGGVWQKAKNDPLAFLFVLNHAVAAKEQKGKPVTAPGLPPCVKKAKEFITDGCVRMGE
jgi:hypothetical protein